MDNTKNTILTALEYKIANGKAKITGYKGSEPILNIPEKIKNTPVEIIAKEAFCGNTTLTEVILPETVTLVGSSAFKGCTNLKYVYLPVDLEVINASCFEDCTSLEKVQIPYELQKICKASFKNCKKLTTLSHYAKSGISSVMTVNKNFSDTELPIKLSYFGEGAFMGCESLETMNIPHSITSIPANLFKNCASLKKVLLHNHLVEINAGAFEGCSSLKELRLPENLETVAAKAFDNTPAVFACEENSVAYQYAKKNNIAIKTVEENLPDISSMMVPFDKAEEYKPYYTKEEGLLIEEKCEIRPAIVNTVEGKTKVTVESPSAFTLKDGIYYNKKQGEPGHALIRMVGDLMCKGRCQKSGLVNGAFNFDECLAPVAPLLKEGDLTIGNMETMSSISLPYTMDQAYVNDRPYLNAPNEFITAIKKAGVDAVINAQNHIYDAGMRGVIETLEVMNRNQLMHTGVFASKSDKRFLSIVVNGIHIAVIAYYDGARQAMKKAYFTEYGKEHIFNMYDKKKVEKDVQAAKAEGAEFIIAYCHWGREYTEEITKRQAGFAQEVADAGVDYIFGSHSHCPQPYKILTAADGRLVPVLYSGGNFLSEINIKPHMSRNSLVASLELVRDENGKVVIKEDGYFPCRIMKDPKVRGEMVVVPTDTKMDTPEKAQELITAEKNVDKAVGVEYKKLSGCQEVEKATLVDDGRYGKYTLQKPLMVEIQREDKKPEARYVKSENGIYEGTRNLETKEAVLVCAGQIRYDADLGNRARFGGYYNFRENFQLVKKCFEKADFAIGNFTAVASEEYLSTEMMKSKYNPNKYYSNARVEYLEALKYAGFDCLAAANPNNLDAGVDGIWQTVENIKHAGLLSVGLGEEKNKIFNINDIRIGVLSYALDCKDADKMITSTGASLLLNIYSPARAKQDIAALREQGADFVLVYLNCGGEESKKNLVARKALAEEAAEQGADYIICTIPKFVTKYYTHKTADNRVVPIATSLGNFMAGKIDSENDLSALIRITLYKRTDGSIEINDDFIPLKQFESLDGYNLPIVPAIKAFYPKYSVSAFPRVITTLNEKLGGGIPVAKDRIVKIGEYFKPQLTFKEIYELLGEEPSAEAVKSLKLQNKASTLALRRADLAAGCVAILVDHKGYKKKDFQITIEDAKNAGASLIIANEEVEGIPCIVRPGELKKEAVRLLNAVVDKYQPVTVAITGTAGKTTTKELTSCVFDTHYNTLRVEGNYNQLYTCGTVLQKLTPDHGAYIQEVHGGTKNSAKNISNLIKPDIAIITNIGDGHLLDMGTIENVIKGKLDIAAGLKESGVLIVNNDNEYMKDLQLKDLDTKAKRIIHYSTSDTHCEYYAQNIENHGSKVKFQVVCEKGTFDVVLNMQGLHNVGNALAVFAAGIEANIPPHKIIAGLTHYVPDADKQNLLHFNGYNMIIDTYSATPISVESAMQTLSSYPVAEGARRIAVLGDIPALGKSSEEKHIEVGEKLCKYNFDLMLCVGTDSKHFAIAAQKAGKEAYAFEDREAFNRKLAESIHPGDFILFKSGTRSHLKEETVYPLFGLIDKQ